jgi:RHS repeat-associated protein
VRQIYDGTTGDIRFLANFEPYGVPLEQIGQDTSELGYTGEQTDPNGLKYLRARYMNPATGTFLTRDPVEGAMGRVGSRNGYNYVEGNPANYSDPSGQIAPLLFAGLVLLGGLTFGGLPAAAEWRIAHDCNCGPDSVRNADPLAFVVGRTAIASGVFAGGGLVLSAAP